MWIMRGCFCNSKAGGKDEEDKEITARASDDVVLREKSKRSEIDSSNNTSSDPTSLLASLIATNNSLEWPPWLLSVAGDALAGWIPRKSNSFQKLSKVCVRFR